MAQQKQQLKETTTKSGMAGKRSAKEAAGKQQKEGMLAPEERYNLISKKAYLIAEQRGFQGDMAMEDWLQAEVAVDSQFGVRH